MEPAILAFVVVLVLGAIALAVVAARRYTARKGESSAPPAVLRGARTVGRGRVITIEILNPLEVAASQSWVAGLAGSVAPTLVTKVVYDRAAKMMQQELEAAGVEAVVEVSPPKPHVPDAVPPIKLASGE